MRKSTFEDISGKRYGMLTVVCWDGTRGSSKEILWTVRCDCGVEKKMPRRQFVQGDTVSCGCYHKKKHTTHSKSRTSIYEKWKKINSRCKDKTLRVKRRYVDRGISVCDEWKKPEPFMEWAISNGYRDGLEIDRIDNDKGYCPENCRFVNRTCNSMNRSARNASGVSGIEITSTGNFVFAIRLRYRKYRIGVYDNIGQASLVRKAFVDGFISRYGHYLDEELTQDLCAEYVSQFKASLPEDLV